MADLLLRRGRVLEFHRGRLIRFYDQSSHCSLLCAGIEPDSGARTHSVIWRVRHPGTRTHAVLPSRTASRPDVEEPATCDCLLVYQHWARGNGAVEHAAHWTGTSLGISRSWNVVRAIIRIPPQPDPDESAMDANVR